MPFSGCHRVPHELVPFVAASIMPPYVEKMIDGALSSHGLIPWPQTGVCVVLVKFVLGEIVVLKYGTRR